MIQRNRALVDTPGPASNKRMIVIHQKQGRRKKKEKTGKATMPMAAYIHALLSALHEQHKVRVSDEGQKKKKKARAGRPNNPLSEHKPMSELVCNTKSLSTGVVQFEVLVEKKEKKTNQTHMQ
ncbi:hypothetical protein BO83DRAFT_14581 [Aspergillus eucalypticola CBS 122712]|uniref:Uncharacterized protein n=1 Tax=Aspergillus eucalypticola (strain CBS 122712 / IBT 29274) TaxID=1448314 RepID=A0A317VPI3_ASPEC|nr:uncharacterized protein BO83DRAFT_14581 [Aspergillus eucalypticola CBS 122712]PWY74752.1 hypothetical protein BO83DRAFT_14581 [Aspergillus eucalypticola CBS 122712]